MRLDDFDFNFNYHTHSSHNGHGDKYASDEDYLIAAIKAGFKVLGFSEHCPYKAEYFRDDIRMVYEEKDEYINSIKYLKEKYKDQCKVLVGFECEYYKEKHDEIKALKQEVDYLILGQHFPDCQGKYPAYTTTCSNEGAIEYTNSILDGLDTGFYTYLAHPDYFYGGTDDINDCFIECTKKICKKCEDLNIPMEINLDGSNLITKRKDYKQGNLLKYPNRKFWNIAKDYNIKCVIGVDAHYPIIFEKKDELIKTMGNEVNDLGLNIIDKPFIK